MPPHPLGGEVNRKKAKRNHSGTQWPTFRSESSANRFRHQARGTLLVRISKPSPRFGLNSGTGRETNTPNTLYHLSTMNLVA